MRPLIDRQRQMAVAEQLGGLCLTGINGLSQPRIIELRHGTHRVGRLEVNNEQADRAVALRLHDEPAIELERRAKQQRQRNHFRQKAGDGLGVVVAVQQGVDGAAKADHAATHVQLFYGKWHDVIIIAGMETCRST